jgi:hypothetical protein
MQGEMRKFVRLGSFYRTYKHHIYYRTLADEATAGAAKNAIIRRFRQRPQAFPLIFQRVLSKTAYSDNFHAGCRMLATPFVVVHHRSMGFT